MVLVLAREPAPLISNAGSGYSYLLGYKKQQILRDYLPAVLTRRLPAFAVAPVRLRGGP